jgi:hypothetical protein
MRVMQLNIKSATELRERMRGFAPPHCKFKLEYLHLEGFDGPIIVPHVDMAEWVKAQYSDRARGTGFVLRADPVPATAQARAVAPVEHPWQTSVWQREEAALIQRHGQRAHLAGLQLASDGLSVVCIGGRSMHPLTATLANRPCKEKNASLDIVAYLPVVKPSKSVPKSMRPAYKLYALHSALELILGPLNVLSVIGGCQSCFHAVMHSASPCVDPTMVQHAGVSMGVVSMQMRASREDSLTSTVGCCFART